MSKDKMKMLLSRWLYRIIIFIFPDLFDDYSSNELNTTYIWDTLKEKMK